ncbi:MAG: DUF4430 domain-containing protein [Candidatus Paceibacterota bacterium]|jgi:hypothetical protein
MNKFISKNKKIILTIVIFIAILSVVFIIPHPSKSKPLNTIEFEDTIAGKISVYDFMSKLQNEGKINFTEKDYVGMGKLIVSINGIKNNGNENWIYYVNGVEAQVGVSNYKINLGDIVSWKYEKSNY